MTDTIGELVELERCTCVEVEGENPDCALHGVSVLRWAEWTDEQCNYEPDIDSYTVRRKSRESRDTILSLQARLKAMEEALEIAEVALKAYAESNAGDSIARDAYGRMAYALLRRDAE